MAERNGGVGGDRDISLAEAKSALAWWLDAGVDVAVQEEPRDWLSPAPAAEPATAAAPAPTPAPQPNVIEPSPDTLAELQQWLARSVQLPLAGSGTKRVLPHGPEQAPVMLLSDARRSQMRPPASRSAAISWLLAERMLAAIGIAADQAYSASLSCFHAPGVRMSEAERQACAEIARRHIRLVQPQRLLLLGDGPCVALLGKRLIAGARSCPQA